MHGYLSDCCTALLLNSLYSASSGMADEEDSVLLAMSQTRMMTACSLTLTVTLS